MRKALLLIPLLLIIASLAIARDFWDFPNVTTLPDDAEVMVYDPSQPVDELDRQVRNVTWGTMRNSFFDYSSAARLARLAPVATSGAYNDLTGKPVIFSGSYPDLVNIPPHLAAIDQSLARPASPTFAGLNVNGAPEPTYRGSLSLTDPTKWNEFTGISGGGGLLVFGGDDRGQYTGWPFAAIRGIKENQAYLNRRGALIFATQSDGYTGDVPSDLTTVTEKMRISSVGNVGIGTTAPQSKLHVQGDIQAVTGKFDAVTVNGGPLASVATSNDYNDLANKPTLLRGYDGYDGSQIFTGAGAPGSGTGTLSDYYLNSTNGDYYLKTGSPAAWVLQGNLKGVAGNNGVNGTNGADGATGKNYSCAITGGIRTIEYDKNGTNPAPTMVAFGVELRENGSVVTPATYAWSTPSSGSLLSGSGSASTFTPTVNSTFTAATDNRVDVALTYSGVTCRTTAPVPCTKIGADGQQGSADTKQQIYTKINVATTGDVLNTQAGASDADSFAFRTTRAKGGDIHKADLAVGQTYFYARPTDSATAEKLGIKTSAGVTTSYFQSDGSLVIKGSLTIK